MVKNISITKEAYDLLARNKKSGESFSEVILTYFKKEKKLFDYAGMWADVSADEFEELKKGVEEARKGINKSVRKRIGN